MKRKLIEHSFSAVTLNEMLVAIVIMGVLALIALPNLLPLISKAKFSEAKLQLAHIYTLEKTYYMENSKYSGNINDIGYEQQKLTSQQGQANYKITIESATSNSFTAKATSVVDFDGDGVMSIWQVDQDNNIKEIQPD